MPAKPVLKNLPLRLGNPLKKITAFNISKNSSYLSAMFEKQVFPREPHKGHFWKCNKICCIPVKFLSDLTLT